jgi:hypothetical protein
MRTTALRAFAAASALAAQFGCHSSKTAVDHPKTDDSTAVACDQTFTIECSDGLVDGCARKLTAYHVCMPADEQASQPCAEELARECADGLVDACLVSPPAADTHVCVAATASEPEPTEPTEPTEPSEPSPPDAEGGAG